MAWVVVDTNTLVSGFGWEGSHPGEVVSYILSGAFTLITSEPLLEELERVLHYEKLRRYFEDPAAIVAAVREIALVLEPTIRVDRLKDQPDNRILEVALESGAEFIVTGEKELSALKEFYGTRIVDATGSLLAVTGR